MLESAIEDVDDVVAFSCAVCMRSQSKAFGGLLSCVLFLYAFLGGARIALCCKPRLQMLLLHAFLIGDISRKSLAKIPTKLGGARF